MSGESAGPDGMGGGQVRVWQESIGWVWPKRTVYGARHVLTEGWIADWSGSVDGDWVGR